MGAGEVGRGDTVPRLYATYQNKVRATRWDRSLLFIYLPVMLSVPACTYDSRPSHASPPLPGPEMSYTYSPHDLNFANHPVLVEQEKPIHEPPPISRRSPCRVRHRYAE